jgi:hypothetical protein
MSVVSGWVSGASCFLKGSIRGPLAFQAWALTGVGIEAR